MARFVYKFLKLCAKANIVGLSLTEMYVRGNRWTRDLIRNNDRHRVQWQLWMFWLRAVTCALWINSRTLRHIFNPSKDPWPTRVPLSLRRVPMGMSFLLKCLCLYSRILLRNQFNRYSSEWASLSFKVYFNNHLKSISSLFLMILLVITFFICI